MQLDKVPSSVPLIFKPSKNCWRTSTVRHGALLVDCANFYRAIHEAISKAKRSIFIVGWEVDSTIELLRGEEAKAASAPSNILDLLKWKCQQEPDIRIYILRWDSSVAFIADREFLPEHVWTFNTPENVNFCLDDTIPIGGSHHQKIIVVDDEVAFSGGMDIARQRWDERDHKVTDPHRTDAAGPYGPYHDVQIVMEGPIVKEMAELVRWRWRNAAGYDAIEYRPSPRHARLPRTWPEKFAPEFISCQAAIARTIPSFDDQFQIEEIRQMYLDLIKTAEKFIYIENQYLTCRSVARALNRRLKERPALRAILVSSYDPQGLFESEGLWSGRIDFRRIAEKGLKKDRIRFVCSGIRTETGVVYKRIHSKILVIDDRYLVVASSNINNRSMSLDTECDIILAAQDSEQRQAIAKARNELLGEHSGRTGEEVERLLAKNATLGELMNPEGRGVYTLRELEDERFTTGGFKYFARAFADPREPYLALSKEKKPEGRLVRALRNPNRSLFLIIAAVILALIGVSYFVRTHMSWFTPESVQNFLQMVQASPWAFPIVCLTYIVGGFILFPVTVMSLITAAVFGSLWGPIYAMTGALMSAAVMFWVGNWVGLKGLRGFIGDRIRKVDQYFKEVGIIGIAVLRLLPIAPFSIVNVAAGISSVRFFDFMMGSFLGFLPALVAKGLVGDSLVQVFLNPTTKTMIYLGTGILAWILIVYFSYVIAKKWQKRREHEA